MKPELPMITIPQGFWKYLRHQPQNFTLYLIIADYCQENNDETQANAWKYLAKHKKFPLRITTPYKTWCWFAAKTTTTKQHELPQKIMNYTKKHNYPRNSRFYTHTHKHALLFALQKLTQKQK